jgi:hypothetical protein
VIKNNDGSFTINTLTDFFNNFEPKSDKNTGHCYITEYYSPEFSSKKELPIKLLEVGIRQGFSHILWHKYFTNGEIWGIDNGESGFTWEILNNTGIHIFKENAYDVDFVEDKLPLKYFDYIIDDGSHSLHHQKLFIDLYYPLLKVGGKLIIEDVQGIGYFNTLIEYCTSKKFQFKPINLIHVNGKIDDLMIEITKI